MKRLATAILVLLLVVSPGRVVAQQRVIDFNNTAGASFANFDSFAQTYSGGSSYAGFDFAGPGFFGAGFLGVYGDGFPTLMHAHSPFNLISALFRSALGVENLICVNGFTATDYVGTSPGCGGSAGATYSTTFFVNPGAYTLIPFNWADVTTLAFDSHGGIDVNDPARSTAFIFNVDDVTISVTPEPTSLVLIATGLLGIARAARRRRSSW